MPRKGPAPRRELLPDPIYRSVLVTQIVNKVLQSGKRSIAERIHRHAANLAESLKNAGHTVHHAAFFDTISVTPKKDSAPALVARRN